MMRIIDLTHMINADTSVYPGTEKPVFEQANTIEKDGFAEVKITMYNHTGTHMDAPAHMVEGGTTLEKFKPGKFFGKGICIDCTQLGNNIISKELLVPYENAFKELDFVLFRTDWSKKWLTKEYFINYPTLSAGACKWLANFEFKGIGIDTISLDTIDSANMENHHIILEKGMVIIENLTNLHELDQNIFTLSCFPLKFENADGSPVWAVAMYMD